MSGRATVAVLATCVVLAIALRLFGVLRHGLLLQGHDPFFNERATEYLCSSGPSAFFDWFDTAVWYPLGRHVGNTVYPALMFAAAGVHWLINAAGFQVSVHAVCVLFPAFMAGSTVLATFWLGKACETREAGLFAALLVSMAPGFLARSAAGMFDNESLAIPLLLLTFALWLRSRTLRGGAAAGVVFALVSASWGGAVYAVNLVALHVAVMAAFGLYTLSDYHAWSAFYAVGTSLSTLIPFVGLRPLTATEYMLPLAVFLVAQMHAWLKGGRRLWWASAAVVAALGAVRAPLAGRFYALFQPAAVSPLVASVSEHHTSSGQSFYFNLHALIFLAPVGLVLALRRRTRTSLFLGLFCATALYFATVMVRLHVLLAPAACVAAGIALSRGYGMVSRIVERDDARQIRPAKKAHKKPLPEDDSLRPWGLAVAAVLALSLALFVRHSIWMASEHYSNPALLHIGKRRDAEGSFVIDVSWLLLVSCSHTQDFREAFAWIRHNTPEEAVIMAWWDYGYQLNQVANRTTVVDNNTWNATHIGVVGEAMASPERAAWDIERRLGVDYVMVVFGGMVGYAQDDLSKFGWMVRIADQEGGRIHERDYFTRSKQLRLDHLAADSVTQSLLFRLSYYRFGAMQTELGTPKGYDRARRIEVTAAKSIVLEHHQEVFTSDNWLVRIYRVD